LSLWQVSFLSLAVTSVFGLILFVGYTFRIRIQYPLTLVSFHVALASVTVVLYTLSTIQVFLHPSVSIGFRMLILFADVVLLATYITGLTFFIRFDAKRKGMRQHLIATHLVMAGVTFIFVTSGTIALVKPTVPAHTLYGPNRYELHKYDHFHHIH
jgi:hypothetical protein